MYTNMPFMPANLLLPDETVCQTTWAAPVCAPGSLTWQMAYSMIGTEPSALHLAATPEYAHAAMRAYLDEGLLTEQVRYGFALVERTTKTGVRVGLVGVADLEQYGADSAIRPVEQPAADVEALAALRTGAPLETSAATLLLNDPLRTVIEPLYAKRATLPLLYDFPLIFAGSVKAWQITSPEDLTAVQQAMQALLKPDEPVLAATDSQKYLDAAKLHWEGLKPVLSAEEQARHPARFALCEVENLHSETMAFTPAHRLVAGVEGQEMIQEWLQYCEQNGVEITQTFEEGEDKQLVHVLFNGTEAVVNVHDNTYGLPAVSLTRFLADYLARNPDAVAVSTTDETAIIRQTLDEYTVGFLLPAIGKEAYFPLILKHAPLPADSVVLFPSTDKRFLLECRKL